MSVTQHEIEDVVRQVLEHLSPPSTHAPQDGVTRPAFGATEAKSNASTFSPTENVISRRVLEGRLDGVHTVAVASHAVITPSARDYLRERKITVERIGASSKPTGSTTSVVIGQTDATFDPGSIIVHLQRQGISCQRLARVGLVGVVDELGEAVAHGGAWGLLLTAEPAAALCLANRRRGVRACLATSAVAIREALVTVATNLLVIDPRGRGFWELRQMVREFVLTGRRNLEEAYRERLD